MATIKFDSILQEFSRRIGDRLDSAFTPGGGAFPNGSILDAVDAIAYINKALHKLLGDIWTATEGNPQRFATILPEMVSAPESITFTAGKYTIGTNSDNDFFKLFGAYKGTSAVIKVFDEEFYPILKTGTYPGYPPTASKPGIVALTGSIYIFPSSETAANIIYLKQPLIAADGSFITQDGAVDSPYYDFRNSRIASIAEQFYNNDK